jgi:hypothetical protein
MFVVGYASGVATLLAISGGIGYYVAKHPKMLVRKIMGKNER